MVSHIIHCSGEAGDRELQNRIIEVKNEKFFKNFSFVFDLDVAVTRSVRKCSDLYESKFEPFRQISSTEFHRFWSNHRRFGVVEKLFFTIFFFALKFSQSLRLSFGKISSCSTRTGRTNFSFLLLFIRWTWERSVRIFLSRWSRNLSVRWNWKNLEEILFRSSRILKDSCGGKVFPSRSDFKHCRQMFNTQKEIMRRVGFTDEVRWFLSFSIDWTRSF